MVPTLAWCCFWHWFYGVSNFGPRLTHWWLWRWPNGGSNIDTVKAANIGPMVAPTLASVNVSSNIDPVVVVAPTFAQKWPNGSPSIGPVLALAVTHWCVIWDQRCFYFCYCMWNTPCVYFRVQPGECYHLYTKFHEAGFQDYQLPEMLRTRLEELCLQIKVREIES